MEGGREEEREGGIHEFLEDGWTVVGVRNLLKCDIGEIG